MNLGKRANNFIVIILILSFTACSKNILLEPTETTPIREAGGLGAGADLTVTIDDISATEKSNNQSFLEEVEVIPLKIPGRIQAPNFEYSGLAWFGENLVLLPQFPAGKEFSRDANLFAINGNDLLLAIDDPDLELGVRDVPIINSDLRDQIRGFEGFESIVFVDQIAYLTIESRAGSPMMGYLIRGEVQGELESITLDINSLTDLVPFSSESNATFEAMTYWNGKLYIIYEHNSMQGEKMPVAYRYNLNLELERQIPFAVMDYRVTDATISDSSGRFWVMNYFFPGDTHLAVDQDLLLERYGEGQTHARYDPVERLVELQIKDNQVSRIDQPPIYLKLLENNIARNWEGIVLLEDLGFIVVTDTFPGSILGFCPILR